MTIYNIDIQKFKDLLNEFPPECKAMHLTFDEKKNSLIVNPVDESLPLFDPTEGLPPPTKIGPSTKLDDLI